VASVTPIPFAETPIIGWVPVSGTLTTFAQPGCLVPRNGGFFFPRFLSYPKGGGQCGMVFLLVILASVEGLALPVGMKER